ASKSRKLTFRSRPLYAPRARTCRPPPSKRLVVLGRHLSEGPRAEPQEAASDRAKFIKSSFHPTIARVYEHSQPRSESRERRARFSTWFATTCQRLRNSVVHAN